MLSPAQTNVRMFGSDVCFVDADSRRKNKQTLILLENTAKVYKISEAKTN